MKRSLATLLHGSMPELIESLEGPNMEPHELQAALANIACAVRVLQERADSNIVSQRLREALEHAEAALADIGDATREPSDDLAWCEARAARALLIVRAALTGA